MGYNWKEGVILLENILQATKFEKVMMKEFTKMFENLLKGIPERYKLANDTILYMYDRYVHGNLIYSLKEKAPKNMVEAKLRAIVVEKNINVYKIYLFNYPRARIEPKVNPNTWVDTSLHAFTINLTKLGMR